MASTQGDMIAELQRVNAELRRELSERDAALAQRDSDYDERLAHQAATVDVLKAMSASPGDPQPVFDLIVERARDLCDAYGAILYEFDGTQIYWRAATGVSDDPAVRAAYEAQFPMVPTRAWHFGRAILDRQITRIDDMESEPGLDATLRGITAKSNVTTPIMRGDAVIGAIGMGSRKFGGFSDSQVELLKTFAEQAAIAITSAETYRALQDSTAALARRNSEYGERIEHQAATIDVLEAMSASPGDAQPVFELIAQRARDICGGYGVSVFEYDGALLHLRAYTGVSENAAVRAAYEARFPMPPSPDVPSGRAILEGRAIQMDLDPGLVARRGQGDGTVKSGIGVPMIRDKTVIGALGMGSQEPGGFSGTQIELLETFAEQAVIAITSAETWRALQTRTADLQESLHYQTAISDVLSIISRSTTDAQPVLDKLVETAAHLCDAEMAMITRCDDKVMWLGANHGYPTELWAHWMAQGPVPLDPTAVTVGMRTLTEGRVVHVHDVSAVPDYPVPHIALGGLRTILGVPLRNNDKTVGHIGLARSRVEPFTARQVALLENFAAQAVIAMENARLLTEQREALEQQTATSEVLQVINASPGNLTPVFEAMLDKAMRLCGVAFGMLRRYDGEHFHPLAARGLPEAYAEFVSGQTASPGRGSAMACALETGLPVQEVDIREEEGYKNGSAGMRAIVELAGGRTVLHVPLIKDRISIGFFTFFRQEVRAFSDKEIALLENFAAQAVIAMENARLLTEQREALEQQTATSEVLQVINASPGDLAPVFQTMLDRALRLCGATFGELSKIDGDLTTTVAVAGMPAAYSQVRVGSQLRPGPGTALWRYRHGENIVHVADLVDTEAYRDGDPVRRTLVDDGGARALLAVPLRKDDALFGAISIFRQEPGSFTEKQIALLENFAAQAVIAMENARLLTEQREALERQTATAEVLQAINANPGNLSPVFDAMLERALRLCGAAFGILYTFDGEEFHMEAARGVPAAFEAYRRQHPMRNNPNVPPGQAILTRRPVQVEDVMTHPFFVANPELQDIQIRLGGIRAVLNLPLVKDGTPCGMFVIYRAEPGAFPDRQIALLEDFGAQAVIAMDNARLLTEQREALKRQTAMAEVLQVINTNPGNLRPVFDIILAKAHAVCGADLGGLFLWNDTHSWLEASLNYPEPLKELLSRPRPLEAGFFIKRLTEEPYVHIPDCQMIAADINRTFGPGIADYTPRTALAVALRGDGVTIGHITANRLQMRPYTAAEISLLESFAAQAVIAMDNARLLNEIRQRQSELDITFENMGDGVAMFDREQKLAAWNRNFQDILDLPDDAVRVGLPFADYIRGLAERGEYGPDANADEQIARLTALLDQANRFERTRPNGHVIDIRQNPIPGGGFVIIYADITERKHAEEALRIARDEAETALRDLKLAQANLVQAEKMASLGQLTAGIAHEIKNPLNFVNNFASLSVELLDDLKETAAPAFATLDGDARADVEDLAETLTGNLKKIEEHGKRADGIVRSMLEHSRGSSSERRAVDISELVDEALNLAYHGARAQDQNFNVTLERDFAPDIAPVTLAPQDMTRVLLNLIGNGFYAARKRREAGVADFEPTLKVATRDLGDAVEFRVRDNGIGISPDIRDKLFQPFFTTKPTGEGTGLGLSITWDVVTKAHAGTITVDSEPGDHTEFTVTLPRHAADGVRP